MLFHDLPKRVLEFTGSLKTSTGGYFLFEFLLMGIFVFRGLYLQAIAHKINYNS
jgi:hypothetical protein